MATKRKSTTTKRTASTVKQTGKKVSSKTTKKSSTKTTKSAIAKASKIASIKPVSKVENSTNSKSKNKSLSVMERLRRWNMAAGLLHLAQAVAVVLLASNRTFPVTTSYLTTDSLAGGSAPVLVNASRSFFDLNLAYVIAAFFALSAIAHFSVSTWYRKKYESDLSQGINRARWYEYSLSASTMIVAIAMIAGVADFATLLMMFGLTAVMNLCGLVMELHNKRSEKVNWSSYVVGCVAGALPWFVYAWYVFGSSRYGEASPPTFVYAILVSIFLMFNSFAINMWLQYKRKGRWADYLYGEKTYIVLSLVAKTLLAWQVFAGALRP